MGKKGHLSRKGVGEIDDTPRSKHILCRLTMEDMNLVNALSQALGKSKNQIIIESLRIYARYHAQEIINTGNPSDRGI